MPKASSKGPKDSPKEYYVPMENPYGVIWVNEVTARRYDNLPSLCGEIRENLATNKYNDGTDIPLVTDLVEWAELTTPGYCWYNNDSATYAATYGAMYN